MTTIRQVTKYLLDNYDELSTMKLQKLCYFIQGYYLAINNGEPLFNEDFQAWRYGPVSPDLYALHAGENFITKDSENFSNIPTLHEKYDQDFILNIANRYINKSGLQLGDITHTHSAWKGARGNIPETAPSRSIMSKENIRKDFENIVKDSQFSMMQNYE